jgi:uncharacterized membrane protein
MHFLVLFDFPGRLHPAMVHLPIGILLLGCLLELFTKQTRYASFAPAIRIIIFWGAIAAIFSVATGLLLSGNGEYEEEYVNPHEWAGISAAILSTVLYLLYRWNIQRNILRIVSFIVLATVAVTGHLGGNVTRGPEFLTEPFTQTSKKMVEVKPIPNIQHAAAFSDVVQPILKEGCYKCHGPKKHKGKLRFDEKEAIIKGGKNGKTVVAGNPEESEMIKRLLLPLDNEDHMPPKSKPQLTRQQIAVLQWWINTGADFNKRINELKQPDEIKPALLALESGTTMLEEQITDVPDQPVTPGDTAVIRKLFASGVMVMPVASNSNYLAVNFVTATTAADTLVKNLQPLKKQVISLKLDQARINDSSLTAVADLTNLRRLQLSNTSISDAGIKKLSKLKDLTSLNLVGTPVTAKGVIQLCDLKELKYIYLYKTSISQSEMEELRKNFPETTLDFGNYTLPMLQTDTTEVKYNQ